MRIFFALSLFFSSLSVHAQTLGGNAVFNFLRLPPTPLLTASGGVNVSCLPGEVGFSLYNPATLTPAVSSQLGLAFTSLPGSIKTYALSGAWESERLKTVFGGQIFYVNYGTIDQTDAAGNLLGDFHPADMVAQVSASRSYLEKWNYGASLKFIGSNYGAYRSSAIALDFGLHYLDSANGFSAGLLARNMGVQITTYTGEREDLPFALEIGITKRLAKSPLGFSIQAQHLQRFDILYNDTTFNIANDFSSNHGFANKLLNHLVVAAHIYAGKNLEGTVGYNRLRRTELNIGTAGNGLNGFSLGLRVKLPKLQVLYARSNYQKNIGYNQLGLSIQLDKLAGKKSL